MKKHDWGDVVGVVFVLATVFVLVRPGSLAPNFITAFGQGMTSLISYVTAPTS